VFLATRAPLMCGAVHFLKHLIHQHVLRPRRNGRHRRLVRAAAFVLDQLLPTAFYGAWRLSRGVAPARRARCAAVLCCPCGV
jgi:hypothetical protein